MVHFEYQLASNDFIKTHTICMLHYKITSRTSYLELRNIYFSLRLDHFICAVVFYTKNKYFIFSLNSTLFDLFCN